MSPVMQMVVTVVCAVLASSWVGTLIQNRLNRKDDIRKSLADIAKSILDLDEKIDLNAAKTARECILRFDDEIQGGMHHSKDYFRQILEEDIPKYDLYCETHKEFQNGFTESAKRNIQRTYDRLVEEHAFAKGEAHES